MIGYFEGFEDTAYWDEYGQVWTIGYGHTGEVSPGDTITKKQALKLLQQDCEYVENFVNNKEFVPQTLNQAQFDALFSFGFNVGPYALPELCKGKTLKKVAADILDYCHAGGVRLDGLVKRRKAESHLILFGNTGLSEIDSIYGTDTDTPTTPTETETVKFTYTVMTSKNNYVKSNGKTAGNRGEKIIGIAIKASSGEVRYRVHTVGGSWLPYVTGYDLNDYDNGYAGNGNPIDLVEVTHSYATTKYRVSPVNEDFYDYQIDNQKGNGMDEFAGDYGKAIDCFQLNSQ